MIPETSTLSAEGCPVDWAKNVVDIVWRESCGRDVMCRDGMTQLHTLLGDITGGKGQASDIELLRDLCNVIAESEGCEIAQKAAAGVFYSLDEHGGEWEAHCVRKRCTTMTCPCSYNIYIDPALCQGCHACLQFAPVGAVASGEGMVSVVEDDSKLKTDEFMNACPKGAIKKLGAGAVKPSLPEAPVPVGSFAGGGTVRRRRRRGGGDADE